MELLKNINIKLRTARSGDPALEAGEVLTLEFIKKYLYKNIFMAPRAWAERNAWFFKNTEKIPSVGRPPSIIEIEREGKKLFLYDLFCSATEVFGCSDSDFKNHGMNQHMFPRDYPHYQNYTADHAFISNPPRAGVPIDSTFRDWFHFVDLETLSEVDPPEESLSFFGPLISEIWDWCATGNTFPGYARDINVEPEGVIYYTHLGLGDEIICFGLINHLSEIYDKVIVASHKHNKDQLDYFFQENPKVEFASVSGSGNRHWKQGALQLVRDHPNFKPVISGDVNNLVQLGQNFSYGFYHFHQLSYSLSLSKFKPPAEDERQTALADHLKKLYNITGDYAICSAEWSKNKNPVNLLDVDLKGHTCDYPLIYIKQEENIFSNMFLLKKLVLEAKQVFFIDSAFAHFLERIGYTGEAYLVRSLKGKPYSLLTEVKRHESSEKSENCCFCGGRFKDYWNDLALLDVTVI
jgi:hypothetical protein